MPEIEIDTVIKKKERNNGVFFSCIIDAAVMFLTNCCGCMAEDYLKKTCFLLPKALSFFVPDTGLRKGLKF